MEKFAAQFLSKKNWILAILLLFFGFILVRTWMLSVEGMEGNSNPASGNKKEGANQVLSF
jgi:hypothetical protein